MTPDHHNVLLVGVGGQGVVTCGKLLCIAAEKVRLAARAGQLHGMSQRGGSVECTVVFAPGCSHFIELDQAQFLVAFEPIEGLRAVPRLHSNSTVLVNKTIVAPFEAVRKRLGVPSLADVLRLLKPECARLFSVDADVIAGRSGNRHTLNVAMLGVACGLGFFPFGPEPLAYALAEHFSGSALAANRRALDFGVFAGQQLDEFSQA